MKSTTIYQEEASQILEALQATPIAIGPFILDSLRKVASDVSYTCFSDYDSNNSVGLECMMIGDPRNTAEPALGIFIGDCEGEQREDSGYCPLSIDNAKKLIKGLSMLIASAENDYKAYQKNGGKLPEDLWNNRLHMKDPTNCPF